MSHFSVQFTYLDVKALLTSHNEVLITETIQMKDRSSGTVCPGRALRDKTQEGFESGYFETAEKVQLD